MKEFEIQQIEDTKRFLESKDVGVEEANVGDLEISYFVIPQEMNPQLPDFAFRMTYTDPEISDVLGIFGVSDSVPQELRPYWAAHEVIEFTELGIDKEGRCVGAEEKVVNFLPQELKNSYVQRRVDFFSKLIQSFQQDIETGSDLYTQKDIEEVEASLNYLKSLL